MFSLNRATIIGHLTRDPELRTTANGKSVANFGMATNRRWTDAAGTQQDMAEFHDIVAWGKIAEIVSTYLKKGDRAYLEGRLQTRSWEGQDGVKRYRTEIVAENLIMLSPRKDDAGVSTRTDIGEEDQTPKEKKPKERVKAAKSGTEEIDINDIPF